MSVAFVREESAETAAEVSLPDRAISPHPNLVTQTGLDALHRAVDQARVAYEAARATEDQNERRRASAPALRDLSYFSQRLQSAQLVPTPGSSEVVAFGHRVTFVRRDNRRQEFRIVGEDEADPRSGSISYVAPVARALMGKAVGDTVAIGDQEIEIVAID